MMKTGMPRITSQIINILDSVQPVATQESLTMNKSSQKKWSICWFPYQNSTIDTEAYRKELANPEDQEAAARRWQSL